jgi:eukaryotic-like serine/threonine-protein kinase
MVASPKSEVVPREELPTQFGKYTLVRRIATGGMAEIFLAFHRDAPTRLLVVKRILPSLVKNADFVSMFLDEARIAAQLNHPNIVSIEDVGQVDGAYYMAMEYVHGEDIRRIYNRAFRLQRSLPLSHSIRIIADAALGLGYAHKLTDFTGVPLGVVHRDVSPQNVLVTYEGSVKVVDFGIAKAANKVAETRAGVLKGKYSYMSPEQALGEEVDHRTDLFALGIILYETTTGTRLFKRHNELATLQAIIKCEFPLPSEVLPGYPTELEAVLLKALARRPEDRFHDAEELSEALYRFLRNARLFVDRDAIADFMSDLFQDRLDEEIGVGHPVLPKEDEAREEMGMNGGATREVTPSSPFVREIPRAAVGPVYATDEDCTVADVEVPRFEDVRAVNAAEPEKNSGDKELAFTQPERIANTRPSGFPAVAYRDDSRGTLAVDPAERIEDSRTDQTDPAVPWMRTKNWFAERQKRIHEYFSGSYRSLFWGVAVVLMGFLVGSLLSQLLFGSGEKRADTDDRPATVVALAESELIVLTEPGAQVYIGENALGIANEEGRAGPFFLPPGELGLRVALDSVGFERERTISLRSGQQHEIEVNARKGELRIAVAPWAKVFLDRRELGITPLPVLSLYEGTHRIRLVNPDIDRQYEGLVTVIAGERADLRINLMDSGSKL